MNLVGKSLCIYLEQGLGLELELGLEMDWDRE